MSAVTQSGDCKTIQARGLGGPPGERRARPQAAESEGVSVICSKQVRLGLTDV